MPIVGQFGSLAGLGSLILPGGAFESIATVTVGSGGASSITFSDIPSGFQHLQIRGLARGSSSNNVFFQFNSNTASNYPRHYLLGDGATASAGGQSATTSGYVGNIATAASTFGGWLFDVLDYASTSKNKVTRSVGGWDANGSGQSSLLSTVWLSTSAVTSISIFPESGTFAQHSTAALYGLRAP